MTNDGHFILKKDAQGWRGQLLLAELLNDVPWDFADQFLKCERVVSPSILTFAISRDALLPDVLGSSSGPFWLTSKRLVSLLEKVNVSFATYSVRFVDVDTSEPFETGHLLFQLLDCRPSLDTERSIITEDRRNIEKLILSPEAVKDKPLLFRDLEFRTIHFVHTDLLDEMRALEITGYRVVPISEYKFVTSFKRQWGKPLLPG